MGLAHRGIKVGTGNFFTFCNNIFIIDTLFRNVLI